MRDAPALLRQLLQRPPQAPHAFDTASLAALLPLAAGAGAPPVAAATARPAVPLQAAGRAAALPAHSSALWEICIVAAARCY